MPFDQRPRQIAHHDGCQILAVGIDTLRETFNVRIHPQVLDLLQAQKEAADEIDYNGAPTFALADESAVVGRSVRGVRFFVRCEGFDLLFRHTPEWNLTVWYGSGALWQIGLDFLRERARDLISKIAAVPQVRDEDGVITVAPVKQWQRLTDIHVCVDLLSAEVGDIMGPGVERMLVLASGVKYRPVGANQKHQTLTFGSKSSVEISIYDKGREIREASGKTWFKEIWERSGVRIHAFENIWRVEMRLAGDWLKDRQTFTFDDFRIHSVKLLQDALWNRRLCDPQPTAERDRWPLHWLWQQVILAVAGEIVAKPLGLRLQRDTEALPDMLKRQAAGVTRTAAVVHKALNPHDRRSTDEITREVWADVKAMLFQDKEHEEKKARTFERYRKIADPR